MSPDRSGKDDEDETPPTRSYVDALLKGSISDEELRCLKSEIGGARYDGAAGGPKPRRPAGAPRLDEDDEDDARTRSHSYTLEERQSARPEADDDEDEARTIFRPSRTPAARPVTVPPGTGPHSSGRPPPRSTPPASARARGAFGGGSGPASSGPTSAPASPHSERPLVDFGDLLADEIPTPPPVDSGPGLRSYERRALDETFLDALGGADGVPRIAVSPDQLKSLPLGAGEGFLVSRIDGESSVDDLIDISGLPRLETLRILYQLLQQGVVAVGRR